MPTLVIAGNSFIGRAVRLMMGSDAVAVSRHGPLACNIVDPLSVDAVIKSLKPDAIINCAGVVDSPDIAPFYDVHVRGTINLIDSIRRHVPKSPLVLIGSAAEYGPVANKSLPITEDCYPAPTGVYGASKLAQTQLGIVAVHSFGLRVRTGRLFNVIGPDLPLRYFVASMAHRLQSRSDSTSFQVSNLNATRDFIDSRDAASALIALSHSSTPDGVYNVATGKETSLRDVATFLGSLAGGCTPVDGPIHAGRSDVSRSCADISRLKSIGWKQQYDWHDSIMKLWMTIQSQANGGQP
ncbi:MAG: NAD-dependent epimerase/dehydratase family protein [Planctomycetia bacterium]|nr:NAD-dependent epimerase/dehydratase family protein [Planctomycetia bacterium]